MGGTGGRPWGVHRFWPCSVGSFRLLELELANLHEGLAANELGRAESKIRSFQSPIPDRTLQSSRSSAAPRGMSAYKPRVRFLKSLRERHVHRMISWYRNKTGKRRELERKGKKKRKKKRRGESAGGKGASNVCSQLSAKSRVQQSALPPYSVGWGAREDGRRLGEE